MTKAKPNIIEKSQRPRFWELDFIRGVCVLFMVIDHVFQLMYISDNPKLYDICMSYLDNPLQNFLHPIIRAFFFLVCGVSCLLSKSNFKRGVRLLGVAAGVSLVTQLLSSVPGMEDVNIYFGVLHMLAISILVYALLATFSGNIPVVGKYIPAFFGVLALFLFYFYIRGKSGDERFGYFPIIIGFDIENFTAADHAPLFPEMAYVLIGTGLGQFYKSSHKYILKPLDGMWNKPVCFIGKQALIIYLLQPIILGTIYMLV